MSKQAPLRFAPLATPLQRLRDSGVTAVLLAWMVAVTSCGAALALEIDLFFINASSGNASYDQDGSRLGEVMRAAADHWEGIIEDGHLLTIDYGWFDLEPGQLSASALEDFDDDRPVSARLGFDMGPASTRRWYFDQSPNLHTEFDVKQHLYRDLTAVDQFDYFNGNAPDTLEVGFGGPARAGAPEDAQLGYDLYTIAIRQIGHLLGVPGAGGEWFDGDYDFKTQLIGGETAAVFIQGGVSGRYLAPPTTLMSSVIGPGERKLPSATDILAVANPIDANWSSTEIDVNRTEFLVVANSNWNNRANWLGNRVPDNDMDVYLRDSQGSSPDLAVGLTANGVAGNIFVSEGANLDANGFKLDVTNDITATGLGSRLFVDAGGELEADELRVSEGADVNVQGIALIDVNALELLSNAVLAGRDAGAKTIDVSDSFRNDGAIRAENGAELVFTSSSAFSWNLDGESGNGVVNAPTGDVTFLSGSLSDAFSGTMNIGGSHEVDFRFAWAIDGDVNLNGGAGPGDIARILGNQVEFSGGTINVDGRAEIAAPATFNGNVQVALADAGAQLSVGGSALLPITYGSARFHGAGRLVQNGSATVVGGQTVTIDVDDFDWDGAAATASNTTVNASGWMDVLGGQIADVHNGQITINAGTIQVLTAPWTLAGRLNLDDGGRLIGTARMDLLGQLVADGAGGTIGSPVAFKANSRITVPNSGDELILSGATSYEGGAYSGNGVIRQNGPATVNVSTLIGSNAGVQIQPGLYQPLWLQKYDWDGTGSGSATTSVAAGMTMTINAVQIEDSPATDGYDGTVNVNGGMLLVNTGARIIPAPGMNRQMLPAVVSPAPWRLDGTMNLVESGGVQAVVASATGSRIDIWGTVNANGGASTISNAGLQAGGLRIKGGATLSASGITASGGVIDVDLGGRLRLTGAALGAGTSAVNDGAIDLVDNVTVSGISFSGTGAINQQGLATIAATTTFNARLDFENESTTEIHVGQQLRLNREGFIDGGATINGPGLLRNMPTSLLTLDSAADIDVSLVNEGTLAVGFTPTYGDARVLSLTQTPTGILQVGIGEADFNVLNVTGTVQLAGALRVNLNALATPILGQSFEFLRAQSVSGGFTSILLPALSSGLDWRVDYRAFSVVLVVIAKVAPSEDFDKNGVVDGGDLLQWRNGFGVNSLGDADNDADSDGADFLAWQRQMGSGAPVVASSAAVPEPSSSLIFLVGIAGAVVLTRSRISVGNYS